MTSGGKAALRPPQDVAIVLKGHTPQNSVLPLDAETGLSGDKQPSA